MAVSQQIVKNGAVNYSLYYNTLNYFKTIMKNHPSIEHVTQGDVFSVDNVEFPTYPVANITIQDATFGQKTTDYTIQIIVADKTQTLANESDGRTNKQDIPYYGTDDVVDIHANTLSVLNDLTSYTQNKVEGFEINGDIACTPFVDRFNNGLAGWSAEFDLTVHNDKNRCLFFLINPSGSGYVIEDCDTGQEFNAVLAESGSIGQVFATNYIPDPKRASTLTSYDNIRCFTINSTIENTDDWDFSNLPILSIPYTDFETCDNCNLWTSPKVWSTTPERYESGYIDSAMRKWQYT